LSVSPLDISSSFTAFASNVPKLTLLGSAFQGNNGHTIFCTGQSDAKSCAVSSHGLQGTGTI
jgi:hypothetical protein